MFLTDLTGGKWSEVKTILARSGMVGELSPEAEEHLKARVEHATYWLGNFAPPEARTRLITEWTAKETQSLGDGERAFLRSLHTRLANVEWTAEAIHNTVHEAGKDSGLGGGKAFRAIYLAFLGQQRGPRAGHFLASLDRSFVLKRLNEASRA